MGPNHQPHRCAGARVDKTSTAVGHGQEIATMVSHLGRGTGLAGPMWAMGRQQLPWLPAWKRGMGFAGLSLSEPIGPSLPPTLLPETCCTPRQAGPGAQWQWHWESLG